MYPVRIPGATIVLREFTEDDLDGIAAVVGDDQVTRTLSFDSRTRSQAAAMLAGVLDQARLEPRTQFYLAITLPEDEQRVLGAMTLQLTGMKAATIGSALAPGAWGHGYGTDAHRALMGFGFGELGLHRISATVRPDNTASLRMGERLGFIREGTIRDHEFTGGAWRDSYLYSVLDYEWSGNPA
jgi:ribosomal-protein-alanine N-acetyltransferase